MSTPSASQGGRFVPRVGAVVAGKYRIERKLGEGGMGFVVAASHVSLGGQVALKFLSPGDELRREAVTRLTREAQSTARIKSEHVARVLDIGTVESGAPFLVLELLEGMDLHKFVRKNGPLPIADAVEFVLQAAEGVAEAHAMGIVHRDLKPANLFLSHKADGSPFVRVLDFGIAKNILAKKEAGEVSLTVGTDVLGSPLYMSPEQIRNPKGVDPRTDVWSLGAILYKLLTGRAAFEADNPSASLAMIVMEEPTPLHQLRPDISPQLSEVVHRCLEKNLERRFQNVDELACALLPFAPTRPRGRPWVATTIAATNVAPVEPIATTTSAAVAVPPGQPESSSRRSTATIAIVAGGIGALAIALVIIALMITASGTKETANAGLGSAVPMQASGPVVVAQPSANVAPTKAEVSALPPTASAVTESTTMPSATPSSSGTTPKGPNRPTRSNALDDRL